MAKTSSSLALAAAFLALSTSSGAAPAGSKPALVAGSGQNQAGMFSAGSEGAEYSICGNGRMALGAGTRVRLFPVAQALPLSGGKRVRTWSLLLLSGRVDVELPRGSATRCAVLVSAPMKLSALVLSGHGIAIASAKHTSIANLGGELLASTGEGFRALPAMHKQSLGPDTRGAAVALLPASTQIRGQRALVSLGGPATLRSVAWEPVESASGYTITLHRPGEAKALAATTTRQPALESALGRVEPGLYELRVSARDGHGIEGHPARGEIRVIGAELPPGAFIDRRGTIRLAEGQSVRFTQIDGLQVTYGNAGHYARAASQVGLYRDGPTIVHFRSPGSPETVKARLAPRGIGARVFAGPKTARWPSDPLELEIKLQDRSGRPLPSWIEAHPRVTLGVEPLDVTWKRQGSVLRATVAPRSTPGPWVVRVEVEDQFGLPLGRDFVEIATERKRTPSRGVTSSSRAPSAPSL
jgi:hypothetical protein